MELFVDKLGNADVDVIEISLSKLLRGFDHQFVYESFLSSKGLEKLRAILDLHP